MCINANPTHEPIGRLWVGGKRIKVCIKISLFLQHGSLIGKLVLTVVLTKVFNVYGGPFVGFYL